MSESLNVPIPGSWFYTITLNPKLYKYTFNTQYDITRFEVMKILDISDHYSFVVEATKDGNCHYHAWCYCNNPFSRILIINKFKSSKFIGYVMLNREPIIDTQRTYNYMIKDYKNTHKLLKKLNYYYNKFSIENDICPAEFHQLVCTTQVQDHQLDNLITDDQI